MKEHSFTIKVRTNGTRKQAETALLLAFASRNPDGCKFHLCKSRPKPLWRPMKSVFRERDVLLKDKDGLVFMAQWSPRRNAFIASSGLSVKNPVQWMEVPK